MKEIMGTDNSQKMGNQIEQNKKRNVKCKGIPMRHTAKVPPEIGNLTKLQELYIGYYNNYKGRIPPEIGNLSSLVRLDAANCELSGEIPPEIGKLKKLDTLFLQVNGLTGSLTVKLGSLVSLKSMDVRFRRRL
ncbi:hypothetical protein FH972_027180 [Carpinus fangiana]|uniref:Leucine-rich repeat-containing N-terminal plant-type domain-containing protein n=1 Tax=Carpinus fangiana TaxID=176857 RepID=A0A5N6L6Z1_9ROSI|nr:hypothetical protein FH972_027180 [Carpinus fangiana]